jgi:hypothetical protein
MHVELACLSCSCRFHAAPDTPLDEVIRRMTVEGTWFGLAPGRTFEDMIFTALARRGRILCPECGEPVAVQEGSFSGLAHEALAAG